MTVPSTVNPNRLRSATTSAEAAATWWTNRIREVRLADRHPLSEEALANFERALHELISADMSKKHMTIIVITATQVDPMFIRAARDVGLTVIDWSSFAPARVWVYKGRVMVRLDEHGTGAPEQVWPVW